jgi:hypothetical protein
VVSKDIVKQLLDVTVMDWEGDEVTDPICEEAANEIERLRKAGDALAKGIRTGRWDGALDAWTELRGG